MRIAVQGCCHGELNKIYSKISNQNVDLLVVCGDFQSLRNEQDMKCMAVPAKYKRMGDFQDYWLGKRKAPVLTLFIGGNHEASNFLCERYHGGWVAPGMFFLGLSGCVKFGGLRIGGISGIYNDRHYNSGYFERLPLGMSTQRSIYHTREFEVLKLSQLTSSTSDPIDIFLSHEWPRRIYHYGDLPRLLRTKPFFKADIASEELGCPGCEHLLKVLKPKRWFSAHLHCAFEATIPHAGGAEATSFLALDKCIPGREHLRIIEVEGAVEPELEFDTRWLAILALYNQKIPHSSQSHTAAAFEESVIVDKQSEIEKQVLEGNFNIPADQAGFQAILDRFLQDPQILTWNNNKE